MEIITIKGQKTYVVGDKMYQVCSDCGKLVQINKSFFGDLHFCTADKADPD
jgi:hypothetical protein